MLWDIEIPGFASPANVLSRDGALTSNLHRGKWPCALLETTRCVAILTTYRVYDMNRIRQRIIDIYPIISMRYELVPASEIPSRRRLPKS